jgi:hypothetical protein
MLTSSALFWDIMRRRVVIVYRRFGTNVVPKRRYTVTTRRRMICQKGADLMNWSVFKLCRHTLEWMKREGERPRVITMLANHRSIPGNKMSYSCLSCLQCTMHARTTSRTFVMTYSIHVQCKQNGCDITIVGLCLMVSSVMYVTLSELKAFWKQHAEWNICSYK